MRGARVGPDLTTFFMLPIPAARGQPRRTRQAAGRAGDGCGIDFDPPPRRKGREQERRQRASRPRRDRRAGERLPSTAPRRSLALPPARRRLHQGPRGRRDHQPRGDGGRRRDRARQAPSAPWLEPNRPQDGFVRASPDRYPRAPGVRAGHSEADAFWTGSPIAAWPIAACAARSSSSPPHGASSTLRAGAAARIGSGTRRRAPPAKERNAAERGPSPSEAGARSTGRMSEVSVSTAGAPCAGGGRVRSRADCSPGALRP